MLRQEECAAKRESVDGSLEAIDGAAGEGEGDRVQCQHVFALEEADLADGIILSCQARATSPVVKVSYDA